MQKHFSRHFHRHCITISNISQLERPAAAAVPAPTRVPQRSAQPLPAYEIIKGAIVRYSSDASVQRRPPPTAVLIHGILGSRRNMQSFAKRLVEGFPAWQVVLVDLRCHGDSAPLFTTGPHGVDTAAGDVLRLLSALKLFPEILIGHSFGGKVVMSMVRKKSLLSFTIFFIICSCVWNIRGGLKQSSFCFGFVPHVPLSHPLFWVAFIYLFTCLQ